MTINEAKRDLAKRLNTLNIPYAKLTAKTVSFQGFGYGNALFISIHGATFKTGVGIAPLKVGLPKPSEGGYVPDIGENCKWEDGKKVMFN